MWVSRDCPGGTDSDGSLERRDTHPRSITGKWDEPRKGVSTSVDGGFEVGSSSPVHVSGPGPHVDTAPHPRRTSPHCVRSFDYEPSHSTTTAFPLLCVSRTANRRKSYVPTLPPLSQSFPKGLGLWLQECPGRRGSCASRYLGRLIARQNDDQLPMVGPWHPFGRPTLVGSLRR